MDKSVKEDSKQFMKEVYKEGAHCHDTAKLYDHMADSDLYDKYLNQDIYRGPKFAAEAVANFYPIKSRKHIKILDVAAGTGFVAEVLRDDGFTSIDALDPSEGMLEKAREKGLYDHYICAFLDEKSSPILKDTYDCAVICGGMGEGHIPYTALNELARVVKPGGLVCIVMREAYINHSQYKGKLEPHMDSLVQDGVWKVESRTVVPNYCLNHNGVIFKFQVL